MTDPSTHDLKQRVEAFLEPGEITLAGIIVATPYGRDGEIELFDATLEIGELVANHVGVEDWYVYSGNDDPEFSSNQHQGLRLADDGFVWECQHLLRDSTFDIVMYYEATGDQDPLLDALDDAGYAVTGVPAPNT